MRSPLVDRCCIDAEEARQRGEPFPPGQTWYDLLHDIIPHTDRFGRTYTEKWTIKLGAVPRSMNGSCHGGRQHYLPCPCATRAKMLVVVCFALARAGP